MTETSIDKAARAMKENDSRAIRSVTPLPIRDLATRLVEVLDRVKELEIQVNDRLADAESFARRADNYWNQLEKLKSAQTPRPMSEAQKKGVVKVVADVFWSSKHGEWLINGIDGWLPLPDQGKDTP